MKNLNIILLIVILLVTISCNKEPVTSNNENENETEIIKPELLTTKERKCIKAVIINNSGQESDLTTMWDDCTFETIYKYNEDSTYIVKDGCFDTELEYKWAFKSNKSIIFTYFDNSNDTTKYLILKLTESQLKLELIDDIEFRTVYTYE